MKKNLSDTARSRLLGQDILFRAAGLLLLLTMLSIWLICRMYAKYVIEDSYSDSAHVSGTIGRIELKEHHAELKTAGDADNIKKVYQDDMVYDLSSDTVIENEYKVIPGVDIPKDPFIILSDITDIDCELYLKVVETDLPETVYYELTDDWQLKGKDEESGEDIYIYTKDIENGEIKILKDDKIYVSEHYKGDGTFCLTFSAWLEQKN